MKFFTVNFNSNENFQFKNWGYLARFLNHIASYPDIEYDRMHPDTFKLKAKAKFKVTDFMPFATGSSQGLLFNDKVKNLLKNFNLPIDFSYFDITIEHKSGIYTDYNWLVTHRLPDNEAYIDLIKTKFCTDFNHETNRFNSLANFESYQEAINANAHLRNQAELWLTKAAWQYDIIILPRIGVGEHNIIISERLANTFIQNNVTGIEIIKADWIHAVES